LGDGRGKLPTGSYERQDISVRGGPAYKLLHFGSPLYCHALCDHGQRPAWPRVPPEINGTAPATAAFAESRPRWFASAAKSEANYGGGSWDETLLLVRCNLAPAAAAAERLVTPMALRRALTWTFTVPSLRASFRQISLLDWPCTMSSRTSCWRGVKV
jgi:hypothetical protein